MAPAGHSCRKPAPPTASLSQHPILTLPSTMSTKGKPHRPFFRAVKIPPTRPDLGRMARMRCVSNAYVQ
eukprot:6718770-Lingulodinium_polyedra.AAC.1